MGLKHLPGKAEPMPSKNMAVIIPAVFYCLLLGAGMYCLFAGLLDSAGYLLFNLYFICSIVFALVYGIIGFFMTKRVLFPTLVIGGCLTVCTAVLLVTAMSVGATSFEASFNGATQTVKVLDAVLGYYLNTLLFTCGSVAVISGMIKVIRRVALIDY